MRAVPFALAAVVVGASATLGCGSRGSGDGPTGAASASAGASGSPASGAPSNAAAPTGRPPGPVVADGDDVPDAGPHRPSEPVDFTEQPAEPERRALTSAADDPALYANRDFVADHYGVARLPFPLQLQSITEPHDRRALLLTGEGPALEKPLILMVEGSGVKWWARERPLAGTRERAKELTLSRGPRGEVLLFWYDEPTKVVAARVWEHDGGIFADFEVMASEGCDAATVLHWPGRGWVVALVDGPTIRAQLLGESGTRLWPGNGIEALAPPQKTPSRPTIRIAAGDVVEIAVGPRKVRASLDGTLRP